MENDDDPFASFIEWDGENDQIYDDLSKTYVMEVDGYKATIAFDPAINMFRGEFINLGNGGGADFYSKDLDRLEAEGKISLEVYFNETDQKKPINQTNQDNLPESFGDALIGKEKL